MVQGTGAKPKTGTQYADAYLSAPWQQNIAPPRFWVSPAVHNALHPGERLRMKMPSLALLPNQTEWPIRVSQATRTPAD